MAVVLRSPLCPALLRHGDGPAVAMEGEEGQGRMRVYVRVHPQWPLQEITREPIHTARLTALSGFAKAVATGAFFATDHTKMCLDFVASPENPWGATFSALCTSTDVAALCALAFDDVSVTAERILGTAVVADYWAFAGVVDQLVHEVRNAEDARVPAAVAASVLLARRATAKGDPVVDRLWRAAASAVRRMGGLESPPIRALLFPGTTRSAPVGNPVLALGVAEARELLARDVVHPCGNRRHRWDGTTNGTLDVMRQALENDVRASPPGQEEAAAWMEQVVVLQGHSSRRSLPAVRAAVRSALAAGLPDDVRRIPWVRDVLEVWRLTEAPP